jgi:hypothetical protein
MGKTTLLLVAAFFLPTAAVPVWAHHAFSAEFDVNKPITVRGTITKMEWINPHAWIYMDVTEADGSISDWMIELGPPNSLIKRGWTRDSVPPGIEIIVEGHQSKDGQRRANGGDITLPDGSMLFAAGSNPADPANRN